MYQSKQASKRSNQRANRKRSSSKQAIHDIWMSCYPEGLLFNAFVAGNTDSSSALEGRRPGGLAREANGPSSERNWEQFILGGHIGWNLGEDFGRHGYVWRFQSTVH